jgi:hypothetical protein
MHLADKSIARSFELAGDNLRPKAFFAQLIFFGRIADLTSPIAIHGVTR